MDTPSPRPPDPNPTADTGAFPTIPGADAIRAGLLAAKRLPVSREALVTTLAKLNTALKPLAMDGCVSGPLPGLQLLPDAGLVDASPGQRVLNEGNAALPAILDAIPEWLVGLAVARTAEAEGLDALTVKAARILATLRDTPAVPSPLLRFAEETYAGLNDPPRVSAWGIRCRVAQPAAGVAATEPPQMSPDEELAALRRVVQGFANGFVGKAVDPTTSPKHWWGACGFIRGASLPAVLKDLADQSEDGQRRAHLDELAAVERALAVATTLAPTGDGTTPASPLVGVLSRPGVRMRAVARVRLDRDGVWVDAVLYTPEGRADGPVYVRRWPEEGGPSSADAARFETVADITRLSTTWTPGEAAAATHGDLLAPGAVYRHTTGGSRYVVHGFVQVDVMGVWVFGVLYANEKPDTGHHAVQYVRTRDNFFGFNSDGLPRFTPVSR